MVWVEEAGRLQFADEWRFWRREMIHKIRLVLYRRDLTGSKKETKGGRARDAKEGHDARRCRRCWQS